MGYKSTDALMRHLRESGIQISGSKEKRQLINTGYFHGYKGYRFFNHSGIRLPFTSYQEVYATIQYDSQLKTLLYGKMMFIETAIKSIALECIMSACNSENIQVMFDKVVSSYTNAPAHATEKQKIALQQNKLNLQNTIQSNLAQAYKASNPQITHFYHNANHTNVPLWALFEILTMGDFGCLLSRLTFQVRDDISRKIGIDTLGNNDTNRELVYKYIYTLKDLRNAIAHNAVIFDTRFRKIDPTHAMKTCLQHEIGLPYVNFKTIGDYVILMCYYLKRLELPKSEINAFIRDFEKIVEDYRKSVNRNVAAKVIHPDLPSRIAILKKFL